LVVLEATNLLNNKYVSSVVAKEEINTFVRLTFNLPKVVLEELSVPETPVLNVHVIVGDKPRMIFIFPPDKPVKAIWRFAVCCYEMNLVKILLFLMEKYSDVSRLIRFILWNMMPISYHLKGLWV